MDNGGCDGRTHLGRGDDREGAHHSVRVLLPDLGDQQCSHTGSGSSSKRVGDLETLEAVGALSFSSDDVEDRVDQLGTWISAPTRPNDTASLRRERLITAPHVPSV